MSMFSKLNQVKELRSQAKKMQSALASESITISEHGVNMTMDGNQSITKLDINKELLKPEKKESLEKYIKNAHADAIKKVQKIMAEKMKSSGIEFPGLK